MENSCQGGISRRDLVRMGALSIGAIALADMLPASAQTPAPKAKSVIQIWLGGGPSHLDTFDPKPEAGPGYCGPLNSPIPTLTPGLRISQLLPLLAKQSDKYTVIRSMTHPSFAHETATYMLQTGTLPSSNLAYPSIGAVVSLKKGAEGGYKGILPPYIMLTDPLGRFSDAGFLPADYQSFATGGDPASPGFSVEGIVPPGGITPQRIQDRRALLETLESASAPRNPKSKIQNPKSLVSSYRDQAYGLILGEARKAFDLSQEKEDLRKRYGMNKFGQSCLLARRLVENGVPYITVNMPGWDTHVTNFPAMQNLANILDPGLATLLDDLAQRGLLSSTIVSCYGEFGRQPSISFEDPWLGGRHHWAPVFSAIVAGGGFRGGAVVGESDAKGEKVKTRPVYPWDLSASVYRLLGIDPMGTLPHPQGCVAYVTPLATAGAQTGGLLNEIM